MADEAIQNLLFQFYGFNNIINSKPFKLISSSKGIENYQNTEDAESLTTENLISSEETGEHQVYNIHIWSLIIT